MQEEIHKKNTTMKVSAALVNMVISCDFTNESWGYLWADHGIIMEDLSTISTIDGSLQNDC